MWFWKRAGRKSPTVPSTHTTTNTHRNSRSTTMATYFQSSTTCGQMRGGSCGWAGAAGASPLPSPALPRPVLGPHYPVRTPQATEDVGGGPRSEQEAVHATCPRGIAVTDGRLGMWSETKPDCKLGDKASPLLSPQAS